MAPSKGAVRKGVRVRIPLPALIHNSGRGRIRVVSGGRDHRPCRRTSARRARSRPGCLSPMQAFSMGRTRRSAEWRSRPFGVGVASTSVGAWRAIVLEPWQREIVELDPKPFLRGLIFSDGCRITNWTTGLVRGEPRRYEYPRYFFSNRSRGHSRSVHLGSRPARHLLAPIQRVAHLRRAARGGGSPRRVRRTEVLTRDATKARSAQARLARARRRRTADPTRPRRRCGGPAARWSSLRCPAGCPPR
jgi:hypothetical protein